MTGLTGKKALYWDRSPAHEILFILFILSNLRVLCASPRDVPLGGSASMPATDVSSVFEPGRRVEKAQGVKFIRMDAAGRQCSRWPRAHIILKQSEVGVV